MTGQIISNYRILRQIGEGGMGVVYVAEDMWLGRRVAIKFPLTGGDEKQYRARFLREARAVSALNHKNIAAVYDYGETPEGQPYIVMELVTGETLGDILLGAGLSLARAVEIVCDVAEALAEAHRRGVIHRDIKPSNVLVNDRGEVKVLDFGLAKQLEEAFGAAAQGDAAALASLSTRTRSDVIIGTPLYLSPEQARGAPVDGRSDLFALGALLYECLAGRPAFSGANVIEIGAQVLHVNPPPPSQFNPRVTPELDRVTLKALAKDVAKRYQTADEMIADLESAHARLPSADTTRTRRLATQSNGHRSSALLTISDTLRRPRLSPLAFVAALAAVLLGLWAWAYWRAPTVHKPLPAAVEPYERGVAAMREGAYYKASIALKEAVEIDDQFFLARARLAEAWAEQDYLERAMKELLAVTSLVPDRKALVPVDALYLDAIRATVGRKYADAVRAYQEIERRNPDQPHIHLDLGRAYDKNDEIDKAIASYTEAAKRDPRSATAYLHLGTLYGRKQNQASAASAFERAEKIYSEANNVEGRAEVLFQRGNLLVGWSKFADARRDLQQALDLARDAGDRHQQAQVLLKLSHVFSAETNHKQAQAYAREAVEIAQDSNMSDLTARSYVTLGSALYQAGNYDEAQKHLDRALELARRDAIQRVEALALSALGDMRLKQNRTDEALELIKQASNYYERGGYRKEADTCVMLIARTRRDKGDYAGALQTFEEQLLVAEKSGDILRVGQLHRECGAVLYLQERFPEALQRFEKSYQIFKSLGHQLYICYNLLWRAKVLARLGRFEEARAEIEEGLAIATRPGGGNKELQIRLSMLEAVVALDERRYPEVVSKSRGVLQLGAQYKDAVVEAGYVLGLARARSGATGEGRTLCEDALRKAQVLGDLWQIPTVQLALAEALLKSGDAAGALQASLQAEESFTRAGRVESAWRAMSIAGLASHRAGDQEREREYLSRAAALLARLEQAWGAEAVSSYTSRPDVQQLRKELGTLTAPSTP
ncbi:MAG TPA: tetratricopeptide repeat protein [Pyrinomonadaceae bacterium]|nr:tetratricopeptide repeat protein [Pyrinomonadaceae bacterium]